MYQYKGPRYSGEFVCFLKAIELCGELFDRIMIY